MQVDEKVMERGEMRILLMGQCTLHWGRMEFGNLGTYAVIEPLIRELHRVFPDGEIKTTFQLSDGFCRREKVHVLPMDLYYGWKKTDLIKALYEVAATALMGKRIPKFLRTDFISAVLSSDLTIDFSGDIWGANADLVGKHRFIIGLFKDLTAHYLGKKIVMLAGSPGPFAGFFKKKLAKYVFGKFDLVTNREEISTVLLQKDQFPTTHVHSLACPAFLFQGRPEAEMKDIFKNENLEDDNTPKVGVVVCGWNMKKGPFGRWPREDSEYEVFAEMVEYIVNQLHAKVFLLSHNNGFIPPPHFKVIEGRDHQILRQLSNVLSKRGKTSHYTNLTKIYSAAEMKTIIGRFDMLVTGRIHAAVAGFTQCVPTVILDYGHEPKAHKLLGFSKLVGMTDYMADPGRVEDVIGTVDRCWHNRHDIKEKLKIELPKVRKKAQDNFNLLKPYANHEAHK